MSNTSPVKSDSHLESSAPPSQIDDLVSFIRTIKRHPKGWGGVHLHYSVLDRLHQQPANRRMIATAFSKLVRKYEGQIFWLSNFDLFFISKACPVIDLEAAIFDSQRALEDSPVVKALMENGKDRELYDCYDLAVEYDRFAELASTLQNTDMVEKKTSTGESLQKMVAGLDAKTAKTEPAPQPMPEKKASNDVLGYDHFKKIDKTPPHGIPAAEPIKTGPAKYRNGWSSQRTIRLCHSR